MLGKAVPAGAVHRYKGGGVDAPPGQPHAKEPTRASPLNHPGEDKFIRIAKDFYVQLHSSDWNLSSAAGTSRKCGLTGDRLVFVMHARPERRKGPARAEGARALFASDTVAGYQLATQLCK